MSVMAAIAEAIRQNDTERLETLISANPDQIDLRTFMAGQTWLGYAAQVGDLEAVELLIEAGFGVNAGDKYDGAKPICSAACSGHYEVALRLIELGADLDTDDSVRNPLFSSIVGRSAEIADLLLRAGIDASVKYDGPRMHQMDAVAFALMRGETECARVVALWNASGDKVAAKEALAEAYIIAGANARPLL